MTSSTTARKLHLNPPFRTGHVGSLLRPPALKEKRKLYEEGKCSEEDLHAFENTAVQHVVQLQQDVGIGSITDGEMRRSRFSDGIFEKLEGAVHLLDYPIINFKRYVPYIAARYDAGATELETVIFTGKIKRTQPFRVEDFKYLKSLVRPEDVSHIKITLCSPSWMHLRHGSDGTYDLSVYKNDDEYFDDMGAAYRAEIKELYDLGCRHVQIDDPSFCFFCSKKMLTEMEEAGVDHEALLDTYIRAINVCTKDRPEDMTIGVHMCRGNAKGQHFSAGSYDHVAVKLFNSLDVDAYYLEYDTERAGDFAPLQHLPPYKVVVLGLVSTKRPDLERKEDLKARIYEAADAMVGGTYNRTKEEALNQLCISPQCGFASVWEGNPLTEEDEMKKLALLVETAKDVWHQGN